MKTPPLRFKTGDEVTITFALRTVEGTVELASENGRSLVLTFDTLLGGYAGMMPVRWENDAYSDLATRRPVVLEHAASWRQEPRECPACGVAGQCFRQKDAHVCHACDHRWTERSAPKPNQGETT
jgi:hypothetical protein